MLDENHMLLDKLIYVNRALSSDHSLAWGWGKNFSNESVSGWILTGTGPSPGTVLHTAGSFAGTAVPRDTDVPVQPFLSKLDQDSALQTAAGKGVLCKTPPRCNI